MALIGPLGLQSAQCQDQTVGDARDGKDCDDYAVHTLKRPLDRATFTPDQPDSNYPNGHYY